MKKIAVYLSLAVGMAFSGPNQNAVLSVDLLPSSTPSDSTFSTSKDNGAFWVAVRASQAIGLDSYGFELGFDPSFLTFLQAAPSAVPDGLANFLESQGGTPAGFVGQISQFDATRITIAHSLIGSDSTQSPSGAGILAVLRFQPRGIAGDALFSLHQPQLLDWRLQLDTAMAVTGARLTLTTAVRIARNGIDPRTGDRSPFGILFVQGRDLLGRAAVLKPIYLK